MARGKGTANLAASLEVLAGAPLDARDVCPTVEDLYIAANWPYKYIGMKTTVQATGDTYRLVNLDVTQESSWVKEGATEYNDFTGATSQDAGVHGLVPAPAISDMEKFLKGDGTWGVVPMPSFDYSNTSPDAMNFSTDEKVIGTWIDGKPVYQRSFDIPAFTHPIDSTLKKSNIVLIADATNIKLLHGYGFLWKSEGTLAIQVPSVIISAGVAPYVYQATSIQQIIENNSNVIVLYNGREDDASFSFTGGCVTLQYTKTTDQPVATGEKIVGQWIDGKPIYQKIFEFSTPLVITSSWNAVDRSIIDGAVIDKVIRVIAQHADGTLYSDVSCDPQRNNNTQVGFLSTNGATCKYIGLQYTKAS